VTTNGIIDKYSFLATILTFLAKYETEDVGKKYELLSQSYLVKIPTAY